MFPGWHALCGVALEAVGLHGRIDVARLAETIFSQHCIGAFVGVTVYAFLQAGRFIAYAQIHGAITLVVKHA